MSSPERRASVQEGMSTNNRAALAFYPAQRAMSRAISNIKRNAGNIFANLQIRVLALELQDIIFAIEREEEQARRLMEKVQDSAFLKTDVGEATMQNPRTEIMILAINDAVAKVTTGLEAIKYISVIDSSYITLIDNVPGLPAILESLGADIKQARTTLDQFQQTLTISRQEWSDIKLDSLMKVSGHSTETIHDPTMMMTLEWQRKHFEMDPYFLGDLNKEHIDSYNAAITKAAVSMFPSSIAVATNGTCNREAGIKILQDYEDNLTSYFDRLTCPPDVQKVYDFNLPDNVLTRWTEVQRLFLPFKNLRKRDLRLCVFGRFNTGKSSFINAMVGKRVLWSYNGLATAWPIVVRHDKHEKDPVLRIEPHSLDPFIQLLQIEKYSALLDPNDGRHGTKLWETKTSWLRESKERLAELVEFEDAKFHFDPEYRNTVDVPNAVMRKVSQINSLVRLCWKLSNNKDLPTFSSMWPVISVEFGFFAGKDEHIELLDCPGVGEADTDMPSVIMETCLKSCIDGSFCIVKAATENGEGWNNLIHSARRWTGRRPLAVYITHSDSLGDALSDKTQGEVNNRVYEDPSDNFDRLQLCAPSIFLNTHIVLKRMGIDFFEKARAGAPMDTVEILDEYWPAKGPTFQQIVDTDTELSVLLMLWGATSMVQAQKKFNKRGYQNLKDDLSETWESYNFFPVANHFKLRAVQDGYDRRQFRQLCLIRKALDDLIRAQKDLITFTMCRDRDFPRQKSSYNAFERDAEYQLVTWKIQCWDRSKAVAVETLKTSIKNTKNLAEAEVKAAIKDAQTEMEIQDYDGAIIIESSLVRMRFLAVVHRKLVKRVAERQKIHVDTIREEARIEWKALMHSLASEILKFEPDVTPYPRDEIVSVLTNAGDEMEVSVYAHLIGLAERVSTAASSRPPDSTDRRDFRDPNAEKQKTPTDHPKDPAPIDVTRATDVIKLLTDENLPFRIACAVAQGKDDPKHRDEVSRSVAYGLDKFGFMFRPCIPVSVAVPSVIEEHIWDDAVKFDVENGATAELDLLEKNLRESFVDPWVAKLGEESLKTLDGTIENVRDIALEAVQGFLVKRGRYLKKDEGYHPSAVPETFLHRLVTWHACCNVVFRIVSDLCSEWVRLVDKRILPMAQTSIRHPVTNIETPTMSDEDLVLGMTTLSLKENREKARRNSLLF